MRKNFFKKTSARRASVYAGSRAFVNFFEKSYCGMAHVCYFPRPTAKIGGEPGEKAGSVNEK